MEGGGLEYDVSKDVRGNNHEGRLRLQESDISFKNRKTGNQDTVMTSDIKDVRWIQRAKGYCLKFVMNDGTSHRFGGFRETEQERLYDYIKKTYGHELQKTDISVRGWNWGVADFVGDSMEFKVHEKTAFEIPLENVSKAIDGKNECSLEFHQNDDVPVSLAEMRFFVPNSDDANVDSVKDFVANVLSKANIMQITGDIITIFPDVQCLTPRGRYAIKVYSKFLQLHGKTFDYKIPFSSIIRLFVLPHPNNRQVHFVMNLDPPIKQGQTRYHFLIFMFDKEEETKIDIGLSEEDCKEKYDGKLQKEMSGEEYQVVSKVIKALTKRKITVPGNFRGHTDTHCIQCSHKASNGFLYPLEKGFIFVHKPALHLRFDEIGSVNFARSSGSNRSFDFEIATDKGNNIQFTALDKDEYPKLFEFVKSKKLNIKNRGIDNKATGADLGGYDSSEDEYDPYLQKMKKEGRERDVVDSEDEEDEEFLPENFHTEEPEEEWDSEVSEDSEDISGSDSDADRRRDERKKEKQRKAERKRKREEREGGSGGSAGGKKKKAKDPNAPKKPLKPFFLWMQDNRERIKEENPGIKFGEIGKKGGEEWAALDSATKRKYEEESRKKTVEYEAAMAKYRETGQKPDSSSSATAANVASKSYKTPEFITGDDASSSDSEDEPLENIAQNKSSEKDGNESGSASGNESG